MRRTILTLLAAVMLATAVVAAQPTTAGEWLHAVDRNQVMESATYTSTMTVHLPSGTERVFRMKGHTVGDKYALVEYVSPARDAGTRYLRRDDQLWIYFPRVDRTMLVQGHMLREGVQGSDMSYEDMTQSNEWAEKYNATITSETDSTLVIRMEAKDLSVSYPYRDVTIDKRRRIATHMLNYDASHEPIKEMTVTEAKQLEGRWFPVETKLNSLLSEDKWTLFRLEDVTFDVPYTESDFSKRALTEPGRF